MTNASVSGTNWAAGTRLGAYILQGPVGAGGMGEVHLAQDGEGRLVAIKRLLPHLAADTTMRSLFDREIRVAGLMDHPNVVRVLDWGECEGNPFLVTEYVHGTTLRGLMSHAQPRFALDFSLSVVARVAAALHHVHQCRDHKGGHLGVIHRDISPDNLLIRHDGVVKLLDFGVAQAPMLTCLTTAGGMKGKVAYMSPEQIRGDPLDRRSDVFALGVVLYELVTGRRLFEADNVFSAMNRIVLGEFVRPRAIVPTLSPALEAVVVRALEGEPEDRFATAADFQFALEEVAVAERIAVGPGVTTRAMQAWFGADLHATPPARSPGRAAGQADVGAGTGPPPSWIRRRPVRVILGSLWLGAIATAAAGMVLSDRAEPLASDSVAAPRPTADAPTTLTDRAATPGHKPLPPGEASVDIAAPAADPPAATVAEHRAAEPIPSRPRAKRRGSPREQRSSTDRKAGRAASTASTDDAPADPKNLFPFGREG